MKLQADNGQPTLDVLDVYIYIKYAYRRLTGSVTRPEFAHEVDPRTLSATLERTAVIGSFGAADCAMLGAFQLHKRKAAEPEQSATQLVGSTTCLDPQPEFLAGPGSYPGRPTRIRVLEG